MCNAEILYPDVQFYTLMFKGIKHIYICGINGCRNISEKEKDSKASLLSEIM
jgi:hypothetical protein